MVRDKSIARDIWQVAGKQGLFGFGIPEEYGGAGSDDYRFNAVAAEEVAAFSAAVSSCFGIHSDVNLPYIVDLGTDEQKQRWLPGMASGDLISAIAMTEPSAGPTSPPSRRPPCAPTTARADWIVNGSKTFITNGYSADLVIVAARTDPAKGAKGITLFVIEDGMPGLRRGRKLTRWPGRVRHGGACSSRTSVSPRPTGSATRGWASSR